MRDRPLRPPLLEEGETVGVVSCASPVPAPRPKRFERGVRNLEAMGFRVHVAENSRAMSGHTAGTVEQRISDLHAMFADDKVGR